MLEVEYKDEGRDVEAKFIKKGPETNIFPEVNKPEDKPIGLSATFPEPGKKGFANPGQIAFQDPGKIDTKLSRPSLKRFDKKTGEEIEDVEGELSKCDSKVYMDDNVNNFGKIKLGRDKTNLQLKRLKDVLIDNFTLQLSKHEFSSKVPKTSFYEIPQRKIEMLNEDGKLI